MKPNQRRFFHTPTLIALAFVPFCLAAGPGCAAQTDQTSPPPTQSGGSLSLETPVQEIAANPQGKAVLDRDLPGFTTNPNYPVAKLMTLHQLAAMSDGKITPAQLVQLKTDLAAVPPSQVAAQ